MSRLYGTAVIGLAIVLAADITGCAVDQQKEVARYREILDANAPPPFPFREGEVLSLSQAMALANQYNERLGLRGEEYLQSLIARQRAAAGFMPTVSLIPTYSRQENQTNVQGASTANSRLDVPVSGRMNIFNGFSDLADYRAAGRTIEQRRALLLNAQSDLLLEVARTYYRVLRAEQLVQVLINSLAVQEERVRNTRARQQAGFDKPLDVAQTVAQAAGTRVSLIAAREDVATARSLLALLVGVPVQRSPLVDSFDFAEIIPPLQDLQAEAVRTREDLTAARAGVQAARHGVDAAVGQYYPSVTLNLNAFLYRETPPEELDWNALLSANLPIFSAGLIEADVRFAWSQFRQALLSESLTRRQILQEVELAYQELTSSMAQVNELMVQLRAAEEEQNLAEQLYANGLATNLDRLLAQDRVLSTQLQLTTEQFNGKLAQLYMLRAVGRLSTRLPGENLPTTRPATQPTTLPTTAPTR